MQKTIIHILAYFFILTVLGCSSFRTEQIAVGDPDLTFMINAAYMQQDEINAGYIGLEKAINPKVKSLAQMVIDDHKEAYRKLALVAHQKGMSLPKAPDPSHKNMVDQLGAYTSPTFEKEYVTAQIADHLRALELFRGKLKTTGDPSLKQFLSEQIPMIEHHISAARKVASTLPRR